MAASLKELEKKFGAQMQIEMLDIVRSEAHDLSKESVRKNFKTEFKLENSMRL